ncbi:MAG: hypothetical protein FWC78_01520 [Defluviitaleaceae bacterium]|nr:hypothetical protein [Defluviitaleaceae bacterium]
MMNEQTLATPVAAAPAKSSSRIIIIVLAVLAAPIILPIAIALISAIFAVVVAIGSVLLAFAISAAALVISGIGVIIGTPFFLFQDFVGGLVMGGGAVAALGVGILLFLLTVLLCKWCVAAIKFIYNGIFGRISHGR